MSNKSKTSLKSLESDGRFRELSLEMDKRSREALRCYRPSPGQQDKFHRSSAVELILRGGKRAGKSLAVATEFASRVIGVPVMNSKGKPIPLKYIASGKDDPLLYWIIGWDTKHIGQTIHRVLFEPGLFRVIRDEQTDEWRTWNPTNQRDFARYRDSQPAEPVIPERLIKPDTFSWENRAAKVFESVELINGAKICAFPSSSRSAKQGDAVAGIWIDEDIQFPEHLKEWQDRLPDKLSVGAGWMLWSVWPHTRNYALTKLLDRAEAVKDDPNPSIQAFRLTMSGNPFLTERAKRLSLDKMESVEDMRRRDRGDLLWDLLNMYDFTPEIHLIRTPREMGLPVEDVERKKPETPQEVLTQLWNRNGRLPSDWTRYLAIDPSHTRTAVVFCVVPPPIVDGVVMGRMVVVERELIAKKYSAKMLAEALAPLMNCYNWEAFIMDQNIGRTTRIGNDTTVFQVYADEFAKHGIRSRTTGHGFAPGLNKPGLRYQMVREQMELQETGAPGLILIESKTLETQKEFSNYRKKQDLRGGEELVLDEPVSPRLYDAMAALEYAVSYIRPLLDAGYAYIPPEEYTVRGSPAFRYARSLLQKQQEDEMQYVIHLGPGASAPQPA